jgi:diguanylate cyclase (GGDEF)-like protein
MTWALRDLSIACKFFLAAIPLFFLSVVVGLFLGTGLQITQDGLQDIVEYSWVQQNAVRDLKRDAHVTNQSLFRFVAWSSAGLSDKTVSALAQEIIDGLDGLKSGLEKSRAWHDLTTDELDSIDSALRDWAAYAQTAHDVLDVGKDDPAVGTVMLGAAHEQFEIATQHLTNLNRSIYDRAAAKASGVLRISKTTLAILFFGAAALFAVTCLVSYCLHNLVLAPVSAVTKAMLDEADGKAELVLPNSGRKDEIGQMVEAISRFREKTEASQRALSHLARHDVLTGLPNRLSFRETMDELTQTWRARSFALLLLDLDLFKNVNDTRGHSTGDEVLKQVATRLTASVRHVDIVSRLGGDEFAIILNDVSDVGDVEEIVRTICETVRSPYVCSDEPVVIGTSVGIAFAPRDGTDTSILLKRADLALYQAKNAGRDSHRFFESEAERESDCKRALERELTEAVACEQFQLFYQPIVDATDGSLASLEALIRWKHPTRGLVSPGDFIPTLENIGLMPKLGEWILKTACAEAALWPSDVGVAINISAIQIRNGRLLASIEDSLASSGLKANRLEIEITESVLLQDTDLTLNTLQAIRSMGVRVSLDDFGTGFNSLQYLQRFPVDKIKVDQSFVREGGRTADAIIRAIAELGHSLDLAVVAEGVETSEQLCKVRNAGCTHIQGFFIGKPSPLSDVIMSMPVRHPIAA